MQVRMVGLKALLLGSLVGFLPAGAHAARSHDHASAPAHAPVSHVTAAATRGDSGGSERGASAHRGGGLKSSHGGGAKSAFADLGLYGAGFNLHGTRSGVQRVAFSTGHFGKNAKARIFTGAYTGGGYSGGYGGIVQCVAFARADTGIELSGNAANWWDNAAGRYARGFRPEPGAILNFRATGRLRLGHVSVVSGVVGPREILIDHAHWGGPGSNGGGVARGVTVVDVSPSNDWSEVKVSLGGRGEYGSSYPTYGFIYNRRDNGVVTADGRMPRRPVEEVASAPILLRVASRHSSQQDDGGLFDRNSQ